MHSSSYQPAPNEKAGFGKPITILLVLAVIGIVAAVAHAFLDHDHGFKRFMFAYLVGYACVLSLVIANLFFVMVNHLANAGWSVLVRRPMEAVIANVWVAAVLFLPILFTVLQGKGVIYYWAQPVEAIKVHHYDPYNAHGSHGDHGDHDNHGHDDHAAHGEHTPHAQPAASEHPGEQAPAAVAVNPNEDHAPAAQAPDHAGPHSGDHPMASNAEHVADAQHASHGAGHDDHAAHGGHSAELDAIILGKRAYLNPTFFTIRWIVIFGLFGFLGWYYWSQSVKQDIDHDYRRTQMMNLVAGPGLLLFALSTTAAAFDLLMSVEAHWFSTIFGVYYFAGSVLANFAFLIILIAWLQKTGRISPNITTEHYHDLGKFAFGFVFFWTYIAFSQYMLYWYANMPETTFWLHMRGVSTQDGGANAWTPVAFLLLFGHFALPFAGLLSRHVKRNRKLLIAWSIWLVFMHWVDMVWVVMPSLTQGKYLTIGAMEIGLSVGLVSLFLIAVLHRLGQYSLVPVGDPRLGESVNHQNAY